jgi:hypothetical protein
MKNAISQALFLNNLKSYLRVRISVWHNNYPPGNDIHQGVTLKPRLHQSHA